MWGAIVTFILRVCLPLLDTGSCTYCYCDETQTLVYDGLCYLDAGFFSRNSACLALVFWHKPGAWQPTSELNRNVFYAQLFKTTFCLNELLITFTSQAGRCATFFCGLLIYCLLHLGTRRFPMVSARSLGLMNVPVNSRIICFRPFIPLIASNIDNRSFKCILRTRVVD